MQGTVTVEGMALADAFLFSETEIDTGKKEIRQVRLEIERLRGAAAQCIKDLGILIEQLKQSGQQDYAEILDFQVLLLEDKNYIGKIAQMIEVEHVNCEFAVAQYSQQYRNELTALDNAYLNERAADISDLEKRLLRALSGQKESKLFPGGQIVVAKDLTPSQVVEMGRKGIEGIVLEKGGSSSHCVILARSMNIPCIIGVTDAMSQVTEGKQLLLDAVRNEIIPLPDEEEIQRYNQYKEKIRAEETELEAYRCMDTITADGKNMMVYANITSDSEVQPLLKQGGEGVGLLRTEMLYMERSAPPDEDAQYHVYANIAKALKGRPLIIRTLDVGGDKHIPYLNIPQEENPFLGYRAIRYCLDHPEIFHVQIAAILRAAQHGLVKLMLPMIASISEVLQAKDEIETVRRELAKKNVPFGPVSIGMMVETPAAAVMADRFAEIVDFFSIGTNDLTQYLFASDRNNAQVASLNSYYQPALLRMIRYICDCAHNAGIDVGICGQAGEISNLIPLWVGMGVKELSVSIPSILKTRQMIKRCDSVRCKELAERALLLSTDAEIKEFMRKEACGWS